MSKGYEITLSSGDIYVLAAFMNYNYVFGIEGKTLHRWGSNISKEAKSVVMRLENKKYINCDLDGTVYIEPHIKKIINCICDADMIGMFSGNLYDGKKTAVYILEKDDVSAVVKEKSDGKYNIFLDTGFDCREILTEINSADIGLHERILFEEATHIQQKIISFQQDEAERLISKSVKNVDSAEKLVKLLSGNCKYFDVQVHEKTTSFYNRIYSCVLISDNDGVYKMQLDNNDILFIDSVEYSFICDDLNKALNRGVIN